MGKRFKRTAKELFAERLKDAREQCGFDTAKEFADAIGVHDPTYRQWERGGTEPSIADLIKIQQGLNISLDFLIAGRVPGSFSSPGFPEAAPSAKRRRGGRESA